jgi:hypothetical protein
MIRDSGSGACGGGLVKKFPEPELSTYDPPDLRGICGTPFEKREVVVDNGIGIPVMACMELFRAE